MKHQIRVNLQRFESSQSHYSDGTDEIWHVMAEVV